MTPGSSVSTPTPIYTWVMWPDFSLFLGSHYPSPNLFTWPLGSPYPYLAPFSPLGPKPGCGGGKEERREKRGHFRAEELLEGRASGGSKGVDPELGGSLLGKAPV